MHLRERSQDDNARKTTHHEGLGGDAVTRKALITALALMGSMVFTIPALAICFDPAGCSNTKRYNSRDLYKLKCGELWFLRNAILDDHNYCFKTDKGISAFGNEGCEFHDIADLPLNTFERFNIQAIQRMEQTKRC